jgi:hypothetical protein
MKSGKLKFIGIASIILFFYLFGFVSGAKNLFPYHFIKDSWWAIVHANTDTENIEIEECNISQLASVPQGATAFIGHAYGKPLKKTYLEDSIANNVSNFLLKNSHLLSKVIFTGDVFSVPALMKWQNLDEKYGKNIDIHVAPGNHDVERPDSRDVFLTSAYGATKYPYALQSDSDQILIDDSVLTNWKVSQDLVNIINDTNNETILVARHHIPIKELSDFANSAKHTHTIDTLQSLKKQIPAQQTTWIIGDGGAFHYKPRFKCLKSDNHTFLLNGIGETKGDTILLLVKGTFYRHFID